MDDYTFENGSKPAKPPPNLLEQERFNKLIRIMGTFDLATGHANNFDDLLDSLNSELHDVLGHYRQAFKEQSLVEMIKESNKPADKEVA